MVADRPSLEVESHPAGSPCFECVQWNSYHTAFWAGFFLAAAVGTWIERHPKTPLLATGRVRRWRSAARSARSDPLIFLSPSSRHRSVPSFEFRNGVRPANVPACLGMTCLRRHQRLSPAARRTRRRCPCGACPWRPACARGRCPNSSVKRIFWRQANYCAGPLKRIASSH